MLDKPTVSNIQNDLKAERVRVFVIQDILFTLDSFLVAFIPHSSQQGNESEYLVVFLNNWCDAVASQLTRGVCT